MFDPISGFGGTGVPGTYILPEDPDGTSKFFDRASFVGCVQDGPFASRIIPLGPGKLVTDHCLVRGVDDGYKSFISSRSVASTMKFASYFEFHVDLEGEPITPSHRIHDGGHVAVGGEMSNFYSSPGGRRFSFSSTSQETDLSNQIPFFIFITPIWIVYGGIGNKCSPLAFMKSPVALHRIRPIKISLSTFS